MNELQHSIVPFANVLCQTHVLNKHDVFEEGDRGTQDEGQKQVDVKRVALGMKTSAVARERMYVKGNNVCHGQQYVPRRRRGIMCVKGNNVCQGQ